MQPEELVNDDLRFDRPKRKRDHRESRNPRTSALFACHDEKAENDAVDPEAAKRLRDWNE